MTTYDAIAEIAKENPEKIVYLGSKSSFLWIDTAYKMLKKLDFIDFSCREELRASLNTLYHKIELVSTKIAEFAEDDELDEECKDKLESLKARREMLKGWANISQIYFDKWKHISHRTVLDKRTRITDDGITIIIVGNENGHYWSYDEITEDDYTASETAENCQNKLKCVKKRPHIKVYCRELNTTFESASMCARLLGINKTTVHRALGRDTPCKGYHLIRVNADE